MRILKNDKTLKALVISLTVLMITLSVVSISVFADEQKGKDPNDGTKTTAKVPTKDENVYVITDANGNENKRIVSENGTLHYDGYEDCTMPVTFAISYTLDGKSIAPKDLAGKSGHVVMTVKYTNNQKSGDTYVPFMATTGMILDNKYFSNVKVSNGKSLDDGNRNIVIGYGFPGMTSALGITNSDINIPESFTVTADVEKFQIDTIYTVATSDVFKDMKLDSAGNLDQLKADLDKLKSGSKELLSGTNKVYEGSSLLAGGVNKLDSQLSAGITAKEKADASRQAVENVDNQMADNSNPMSYDNIKRTASNTFFNSVSNTQTITNAQQLVSQGLSSRMTAIQSQASTAARNRVQTALAGDPTMAQLPALMGAGYQMASLQDSGIQQTIATRVQNSSAQIAALVGTGMTQDQATQYVTAAVSYETLMSSGVRNNAVARGNATASTLSQTVIDTAGNVASETAGTVAPAVANDVTSQVVTAVATQAKDSVGTSVADSVKRASEAAASQGVVTGINQTKLSIATNIEGQGLVSGANQLAAGAKELNDGVTELVNQAMAKLDSLNQGDLLNVMKNVNAVGNAAKGYDSFGGKGSYNSVKFIYKTDAISLK